MTDIVARLHAATLDNDNFPRMDSERWLPVGLAKEAITEIERLKSDYGDMMSRYCEATEVTTLKMEIERLLDICKDKTALLKDAYAANERLRALVKDLADDMEAVLNGYYRDMENVYKARRALEPKPCPRTDEAAR